MMDIEFKTFGFFYGSRAPTIGASRGKGKGSAQAPPPTHGARGPAPTSAARTPTPTSSTSKGKGSAKAPPPRRHSTASQATAANFVSASSYMQFTVSMGHSIATTAHTQAVAASTKVGSRLVVAGYGNPSAGSSKGRVAGSSQSSKKKP